MEEFRIENQRSYRTMTTSGGFLRKLVDVGHRDIHLLKGYIKALLYPVFRGLQLSSDAICLPSLLLLISVQDFVCPLL